MATRYWTTGLLPGVSANQLLTTVRVGVIAGPNQYDRVSHRRTFPLDARSQAGNVINDFLLVLSRRMESWLILLNKNAGKCVAEDLFRDRILEAVGARMQGVALFGSRPAGRRGSSSPRRGSHGCAFSSGRSRASSRDLTPAGCLGLKRK
jgi:hypothetical protein